jgi:Flp pilus assembly protein TadD
MQTGHWLKVRLHSKLKSGAPLGFGDGAKVIAHLGDVALRRTVTSVSYLSQSSRTVHFGLGPVEQVASLEVRWLGGPTNFYEKLEANTTWEITEGDPLAKCFIPHPANLPARVALATAASAFAAPRSNALSDTSRSREFWSRLRGAMNALKVERDEAKAIDLFRAALELDPNHEDAHYYLGQCLASRGDVTNALAEFEALTRINPQSHRGFCQWGTVRALFSTSEADLSAAESSLEKAHALNPEETGALLVLGEVSILRGQLATAEERLALACRTNPKAVSGFFLRGFLAWQRGAADRAGDLLESTRKALGPDWQPRGATSEGDVKAKHQVETTPLSRFWEAWDGNPDPDTTYQPLADYLKSGPHKRS